MASLHDVVPITETVSIRNISVEIHGIGAGVIGLLLGRFPELVDMLKRQEMLPPEQLVALAGRAVGALIAGGTIPQNVDVGSPDFVEQFASLEAKANALYLGDQAALLAGIFRCTMPEGAAPFVTQILSVVGSTDGKPSNDAENASPQ